MPIFVALQGEVLVTAVKERFPGASITRCVRGKVDIELVLDVKGFSLDKALQVGDGLSTSLTNHTRASIPFDLTFCEYQTLTTESKDF